MKVGVLGTGQLALMMAQANQELGFEFTPYGEQGGDSLDTFCTPIYASMEQQGKLDAFFESVDVVTYESENTPTSKLKDSKYTQKLAPPIKALETFQNRFYEKNFFVSEGIQTNKYALITDATKLSEAAKHAGLPAILKTVTEGYDGRGQIIVHNEEELQSGWEELNKNCLLEEFIDFEQEVSIIATRDRHQNIAFYPLTENFHRKGQLRLSIVTKEHPLQKLAEEAIRKVMEKLDYIGCMAIEFFVKGNQLIVNEAAPRVHNSGHWTLDGSEFSQFTQHLKAIAGEVVSNPKISMPAAMVNCIGKLPDFEQYKHNANIHCYDYGKTERPERKLGHINVLGENQTETEFYNLIASMLKDFGEEDLACNMATRASSAK